MIDRRSLLKGASALALATAPTRICAQEETVAIPANKVAGIDRIRIDAVESFVVQGARTRWLLVRIRTHNGLQGLGEAFGPSDALIRPVVGHIDQIAARLKGADAREIVTFIRQFKRLDAESSWGAAVAGIEIALWDILGQATGQPIYALLGGRARDRIPLCASYGTAQDADLLDQVRKRRDEGFGIAKFDPFTTLPIPPVHSDTGEMPPREALDAGARRVAEWREALGADFQIAIDGHWKFSIDGAIAAARVLEPYRPLFFEEPIGYPNDAEALSVVRRATPIPLATGEHFLHIQDAAPVLGLGAVRFIQPDVTRNYGLLESFKMAAMAEAQGVGVVPSGYLSPVSILAASHLAATIPNLLCQEWPDRSPAAAWEQELLDPPLEIDSGSIVPTARPGLGASLNESFVRAHLAEA